MSCFLCVTIFVLLLSLVWIPFVLVYNFPSTSSRCGQQHHVWEYCLLITLVPITGLLFAIFLGRLRILEYAALPTLLACLFLGGWGISILFTLGECWYFYEKLFPDLLFLTKTYVLIISLASFLTSSLYCVAIYSSMVQNGRNDETPDMNRKPLEINRRLSELHCQLMRNAARQGKKREVYGRQMTACTFSLSLDRLASRKSCWMCRFNDCLTTNCL